jgi:hypothetical protein
MPAIGKRPNGERYPLVGGTRPRHFDGTNFEPRELPENAARTRHSGACCVGLRLFESCQAKAVLLTAASDNVGMASLRGKLYICVIYCHCLKISHE